MLPRNHPGQVSTRGADDSVDDRRTPAGLFREQDYLHRFTLDVAASEENAKLPAFFSIDTDGLAQSWAGHRVWCNPPYSNIGPWVEKAWAEMRAACELVVMLLPANRTEQSWWQSQVEPFRDRVAGGGIRLTTRFLAGRIEFGRRSATAVHTPFGSVLLTWERAR